MSILNMMLAGSGDENLQKGTYISNSGSELKFAVAKEPSEYVLMMVSNKSLSNTIRHAFFCHTNSYDRLYGAYYSFTKPNYSSESVSNITASYSNGVFTLTNSSSAFFTGDVYVLYYR